MDFILFDNIIQGSNVSIFLGRTTSLILLIVFEKLISWGKSIIPWN